jgi:predicted ATPase/DNA-binding CsgD family transcriptional regulator
MNESTDTSRNLTALEFNLIPQPTPIPRPMTGLIGRMRELALASSLLRRDDVRLLTIVGPGGIGKTRVAIEIGRSEREHFADGVAFVPLVSVSDIDGMVMAIARALGVLNAVIVADRHSLAAILRSSSMLLILDNFEHLLAAAPFVTELLIACPHLKIGITSRALLHVSGEFALPLPPLDLPKFDRMPSLPEIEQSSAVALFVRRAQAIVPAFELNDFNASIIAEICRYLDGIPLAIELAAAQSTILSSADLLSRIAARLPLPVSGPRDAPARLRSMRDAIAWSYDLLSTEEQELFRHLGIFVGGFTLAAVESISPAVSAQISGGRSTPLELLASLVDKSLVQSAAIDGVLRFSMFETIRAFAVERLEDHGETDALAEAHAAWCLETAEGTGNSIVIAGNIERFRILDAEVANMRAALAWYETRRDGERLLRLASALIEFWYAINQYRESAAWLTVALDLAPKKSSLERARALAELGRYRTRSGDDRRGFDLMRESVEIFKHEGDLEALTFTLVRLGALENLRGEYERADPYFYEALEMLDTNLEIDHRPALLGTVLGNLGVSAHGRGDTKQALELYERSLAEARISGYVPGIVRALRDLGDLARDLDQHHRAIALYQECLSMFNEYGDLTILIDVLEGVAPAAIAWRRPELAARFLGSAESFREKLGGAFSVPTDRLAHERALKALRSALVQDELDAAWQVGRQMTVAKAYDEVRVFTPPPAELRSEVESAVSLSARELDVLRLLAAGQRDREIADELFISVRTVEAHVARILTKFEVRTRTAAVSAAIASRLIDVAAET